MKKKVLLVTLLVVAIVASCFAFTACNKDKGDGNKDPAKVEMSGYNPATDGAMKVAMITDYGDITDQSFNQTTYEASKAFCEANGLSFKYFKPAGDSTEARVASVEQAVQEGFNVIVMPGYAFGATVAEVAEKNEKVTFVALDVSQGDLGADYTIPGNVATFVYHEELSGFMAGYAAVKEGYRKLGFLGGMAVPAVIRFGYGYVQGGRLYEGLYLTAGHYVFRAEVKSTGTLFVESADTGDSVISEPFESDDWTPVSVSFDIPKTGTYYLGISGERAFVRRVEISEPEHSR